jgi:hypothetical protein
MRLEKIDVLTIVNRKGRERRGLEAIFSSQESERRGEVFIGAGGILSGLILSILAVVRANAPQTLGPSSNTVYSALTFGALGVLLLICGSGAIIFVTIHKKSRISNSEDPNQTGRVFAQGARMGGVAFVQSVVLVLLYSGFVQEFESNSTMRIWVQSNLPVGQSLLNWESVLFFSVVLSLLVLEFLPGRFFSEE